MRIAIYNKSDLSYVRTHDNAIDMVVENVDGDIVVNVIDSDDTVYPYAIRNFDLCVGEW